MKGLALVALAALCCASPDPRDPGDAGVRLHDDVRIELGPRAILLASGDLGLEYFPDSNVVALARAPLRLLLTARFSTWLVSGRDWRSLDSAREVLAPGPAGSFDNGYAGIGGVLTGDDGALYAFYHAEDHEGMPRMPQGIHGFHGSVGAARSVDAGLHWEKLGAVVTGARPKTFRAYPGQGAGGTGIPSLAVDREGAHALLYYDELSQVGGRGVQTYLARAPLDGAPPGPGRWTKYHDGDLSQPGLGGEETAVVSAHGLDESNAIQPHVSFSAYLDRYVMVLCIDY